MRGLICCKYLTRDLPKVIADYVTWEPMIDLDAPPSPEEGRPPISEGIRMSVFPYNCNFRTVNLPDYEIAWLRIN